MRTAAMWAAVAVVLGVSAAAVGGEGVVVLTGFEEDFAAKLGAKPDGEQLTWQASQYRAHWFRKGDVTEGQYAFVTAKGPQFLKKGDAPYPVLRSQGGVFNTWGRFGKLFPADWSAFDRLRVDVKSAGAAGRIRLELEDEICQPMLRRTYALPAGKWVTLEFDLAKAAEVHAVKLADGKTFRGRFFNPAQVANVHLYLEQLDGDSEILLDNLRLLKPAARDDGKLPVLTDDRPFFAPVALPAIEPKPRAQPADFKAVREPLAPEPAAVLDASRLGNTGYARLTASIASRAFVAPDNNHLLLGFLVGYVRVLASADGGTTWRGLDGTDKPTACYHDCNAPSHAVSGDATDMFYVHSARCGGGGTPAKMFFRHLRFDGKGWQIGPPRLVDADCRHCPEFKVRVMPLPTGRLWAVWMHHDRHDKVWLRGRFSDDDGLTWRDPDSNALLHFDQDNSHGPQRYGVTLWPVDEAGRVTGPDPVRAMGRIDSYYAHGAFELARYDGSVACIYTKTWHPTIHWAVFDGQRWTESKLIGNGFPRSAVTVGAKTIYLTVSRPKADPPQLLRLDGDKWVDDTPPGGQGGLLTVSGDRLFCFWKTQEGEKFTIWYAWKSEGGKWSGPAKLAEEPVAGDKPALDIAAPAYAPRNFVPIAWGPPNAWIKFLRLPRPAQ